MMSPSVKSVPTVTRFCNSSSTPVSRLLSSSPSLRLRSSNSLLPTLALTTGKYICGVSSYHASNICHYSSSSSSVSQSESTQEKTSPFRFDEAIHSLVQIYYFWSEPKPLQPWNWKKSDTEKKSDMGCGFVISGRRILTETISVSDNDSSGLRVRKYGSPTFYTVKVEAAVPECGLAILVVDSEEFWENMHPLELGDDIPSVGETVSVFGYDRETIQLTEVTVTSVEPRQYYHGTAHLLAIQIDTGYQYICGPVVMGNKIVGLYPGVDEPGIIPTSVIKQFLSGIEEKNIGFGSLDISWQPMKDAQLRRHFKMSDDMIGVLITGIDPLSNALNVLNEHDVILAVEGLRVYNDETVHFQDKEWLHFTHLVSMKKPGETVLVKVLRDGKEHEFNISLNLRNRPLVPEIYLPSYYILDRFVFVPLSKPYIDKSSDICESALKRKATKADEQIVIISQVLWDDIYTTYSGFKGFEVKKVNGVKVVNLKHLSELIENCCTEDLRFDLEDGYVIVLNNLSAKEATSLILERHGIPSAMSNDLQETNSC